MEKLKTNRSQGIYIAVAALMQLMPFIVLFMIIKKVSSGLSGLMGGNLLGGNALGGGVLGGGSLGNPFKDMLVFAIIILVASIAYFIYVLVLFSGVTKDMNTVCERSNIPGKSLPYILVVLLSFITGQIYNVIWSKQQGKRLFDAAGSYGRQIKGTEKSHLRNSVLGSILTWVTALYYIIKKVNPNFHFPLPALPVILVLLVVLYILSFFQIANMASFIRDVNILADAYNGQPSQIPMDARTDSMQANPVPQNPMQEAADNDYTMPVNEWKPEGAWAPEHAQQQGGAMECCRGIYEGAQFPVLDEIIIGRDETCAHVVIKNPEISRRHCSVRYNPANGTYMVTDYSSNGVYYKNGQAFPKNSPVTLKRPLKNILFFNIEFLMHAKNPPVLNGLMDFL